MTDSAQKVLKYTGIFPAFYACYDEAGEISPSRTRELAKYLLAQGVQGLYVNGSSGECVYLSVSERKTILENVMEAVGGKMIIISHVACNNTRDSMELARHAQSLGVDAIAAIPPIYFHLPEHAIAKYWNDISSAAPDMDFIIYNIPQLAGVSLTMPLLADMLKNPSVIGVKNSSMPVQDIQMFKAAGAGHLVLVSSVLGNVGVPGFKAAYSASKAGVTSLGESLRAEYPSGPIKITVLEPGYIESEMTAKSNSTMLMVDNETGVKAMVDAIEKEKGRAVVPGWPWWPLVEVMKLVPPRFTKFFA